MGATPSPNRVQIMGLIINEYFKSKNTYIDFKEFKKKHNIERKEFDAAERDVLEILSNDGFATIEVHGYGSASLVQWIDKNEAIFRFKEGFEEYYKSKESKDAKSINLVGDGNILLSNSHLISDRISPIIDKSNKITPQQNKKGSLIETVNWIGGIILSIILIYQACK